MNPRNRLEVFCKKGAFENFTKLTGKLLCQSSLFNYVEACYFVIKETLAEVFPVSFVKFLRTPSFTEYLRWLLLEPAGVPSIGFRIRIFVSGLLS